MKIEIEIPSDQAERLVWAVKAGIFEHLNITAAKVLPFSPSTEIFVDGSQRGRELSMAREIATTIQEERGENIILLDLTGLKWIANFMVICSARTKAHLCSIRENLTSKIFEKRSTVPLCIDGDGICAWSAIDYDKVIVQLFAPEMRAYYDLEGLWSKSGVVV